MDPQHQEQTRRLEEDFRKLDLRMDRQIELYAISSNELAALKQEVTDMKHYLHTSVDEIKSMIIANRSLYASKEELIPLRLVVYGGTGGVLLAFLGALTAFIMQTP